MFSFDVLLFVAGVSLIAGFFGGFMLCLLADTERIQGLEARCRSAESALQGRQDDFVLCVRVQDDEQRRRWEWYLHGVEVDIQRGLLVLERAARGRPFTEAEMSGPGLLSRRQFRRLRDRLLAGGFLEWSSSDARNQGVEWTASGRALLRAVVERIPSPTLEYAPACV